MKKSDDLYILEIEQRINTLRDHLRGISKKRFLLSTLHQSATIRELEVIGEAAKRDTMIFRTSLAATIYFFSGLIPVQADEIQRCFPSNRVEVSCLGLDQDGEATAELALDAISDSGLRYSYGYFRMIDEEVCLGHFSKIRDLLKTNSRICITGWGEMLVDEVVLVHWSEVTTVLGRVIR